MKNGGHGYAIAAKECLGIIEHTLRELFREHLTKLEEKDRLKVTEEETKIGKGRKGIENFTMGQLVGLFHRSKFIEAWARVSGRELSVLHETFDMESLKDIEESFTGSPKSVIIRFFQYRRYREGFHDFVRELAESVNDRETPVVFVISMRRILTWS
ncbi:hypothetical protein QUF72_15215 [Desulfobacterales bacterium HSG2]|nr:hypothetical protein [Desulfobacterales bacterium HSG2]